MNIYFFYQQSKDFFYELHCESDSLVNKRTEINLFSNIYMRGCGL